MKRTVVLEYDTDAPMWMEAAFHGDATDKSNGYGATFSVDQRDVWSHFIYTCLKTGTYTVHYEHGGGKAHAARGEGEKT